MDRRFLRIAGGIAFQGGLPAPAGEELTLLTLEAAPETEWCSAGCGPGAPSRG